MKKILMSLIIVGVLLSSCKPKQTDTNPFFTEYTTPHKVPPFDKIEMEHYMPAFKEGMKQEISEIEKIVNNPEAPTFANTLEALDNTGKLLSKVSNVFYSLNEANTNDQMQKLSKKLSPLVTKHNADIAMNEKLFGRIKTIYNQKNELKLSTEEAKLLEETYARFVRGGADLNPENKAKVRKIDEKLSLLFLEFRENLLAENNAFELVIEKKEDLAGLTETIIAGAAETAKERGKEGKWVFTLDRPSINPFLTYSEKRDLREKIYNGYINKSNNNNKHDNKAIITKIIKLRTERAKIFGYNNYSEFAVERNMAKNPENVLNLLNKLWEPALIKAKEEVAEMQKIIDSEGKNFKLAAWDWRYYAEKVKKAKYNLNESELRPYFVADNVRDGAFAVANKLFGIKFVQRDDIPKYHPDVQTWELQEADGKHIGIFYLDYYPRSSKRGGAWMGNLRDQSGFRTDNEVTPVIYNVGNYTKPVGDKPALLSADDVRTLFHEFGHALHGFLSKCKYKSLSGTSVARDFVELPSQIMENWAMEPEVLKMYAKHYKTGEVIPDELIEKIKKTDKFNQGFITVEYLAASLLDIKYHTTNEVKDVDVVEFEKRALNEIKLIPEIASRYRSTYFAHIFGGNSYASGYYVYIWAEVLDADAFQTFKENDIFDQKTAQSLRDNILSKGGTDDPMILYKNFKGKEPSIEPLLKKRGLN